MRAVGRRMFLYNTVCEVVLYDYSGDVTGVLDACEQRSLDIQNMLNRYDNRSELSRLNQNYCPKVPYPLSKELFFLLQSVWRFSRLCDGAFDATVGKLVGLWDFTAEDPAVPREKEIESSLAACGYQKVDFWEADYSVIIQVPGMEIDGGGFGKGYAIGQVLQVLQKAGVSSALINYGGNMFLLGENPEGAGKEGWRVGIQAPWEEKGKCLASLRFSNLGIATSAGYERYFRKEGKAYWHILDPVRGRPADTGIKSVSIISDNPLITDLMSTAFFVLGLEKGEEVARRLRDYVVLEYVAQTEEKLILSEGAKIWNQYGG